ncbi:MAG: phosphate signaling complex protein PhoU [Pseudomonadota bacterium]
MTQPLEGHTVQRFDGEMSNLHMLAIEMGGLVLNQVQRALESLEQEEPDIAREVVSRDQEVNELEMRADEQIVSLIARRAPVARDLRGIMAISKAICDLERIGDEAAKIAAAVIMVYDSEQNNPSYQLMRDVQKMGKFASRLLRQALEAFDTMDLAKAEEVTNEHYELGAEFAAGLRRLMTFIMEDSRNVGHAVNAVVITKALERIGDHSTNLGEYVIYILKGIDIRHQHTPELPDE